MTRTVAVTGATGLIGRKLVDALLASGDRVVALVRSPPRRGFSPAVEQRAWTDRDPAADLRGVDAVVHLAGAPVAGGRWTGERKKEIKDSRILGTRSVVEGIRNAGSVRVLVSASGIDIHGDTGDAPIDENAAPGTGFLAEVGVAWEAEARAAPCRVVLLRTGMVLAREGGALPKLETPFRLGAGGPMGSGRQYVPWIHVEDELGLILHALRTEVEGPMLCVAPQPVRNRDFVKALGRALHRPALLPAPAFALKAAVGEMAGVILASHNAAPRKALETGYRFRFPELDGALADLFRK